MSTDGKKKYRTMEDVIAANITDPIEIISIIRDK